MASGPVEVFALVLGSSAIAAVISSWMPVVLAKRRLHTEQWFEDRGRAKTAHAEAAKRLTNDAASVYDLVDNIAAAVLVNGVDYYPPQGIRAGAPIDMAGEAIGHLRTIWTTHPTSEVRVVAKTFAEHLEVTYGQPTIEGMRQPQPEDPWLLEDVGRAAGLIELMHSPPIAEAQPGQETGNGNLWLRTAGATIVLLVATYLWFALTGD
jgi:hypothetical protein